jgi:hypothetical protein
MANKKHPAAAHPKVVKKRTITIENESRLLKAKEEYNTGKFKSIKAAATAHNVKELSFGLSISNLQKICIAPILIVWQQNLDCTLNDQ